MSAVTDEVEAIEIEAVSEIPLTRAEVLSFWQELHESILSWEGRPGPVVEWNGVEVRAVTQDLEDRLASLGEFLNRTNFNADAWEVVLALDEFWLSICKWAESIRREERRADPSGGHAVWHHVGRIAEASREKYYKTVEPIEQLVRENVPQPQIARIYGWVDEDGKPDVLRVQQEIREPGSQLDWATWVHPDKLRYDRIIADRWVVRCRDFKPIEDPSAIFDNNDERDRRRAGYGNPEAPESIEYLLRLEGITVEQVSRMKNIPVDEVYKIAAELRIPIDSHAVAMMARGDMAGSRAAVDAATRVSLLEIETYPQIKSPRDRALAMASDGIRPGMILAALQDQHPGVSFDDVSGWLGVKVAKNDGQQRPAGDPVVSEDSGGAGSNEFDIAGLVDDVDQIPGSVL